MNVQRSAYPSGIVGDELQLRYTRMTRTLWVDGVDVPLLDESMEPLVLPPGARLEVVRIMPPQLAERVPYGGDLSTIGGTPIIEIRRVSTDTTVSKRIRTYAPDEIGDVKATPFSQGLITNGLAVEAKKIDSGVCINVLVGSKANPAAGTPEGTIGSAAVRPIGAATLKQYDDEAAFDALASHLMVSFTGVTSGIYDITAVVEFTLDRKKDGLYGYDDWLNGE
jgi:hypothetical protein